MREILFRGKRVDNGKWIEGSFVKYTDYDGVEVYLIYASNGNPNDIIPETVGQYTGLKDKKGNKIFEGDIVKYGNTIHNAIFEQRNGTAYFGLVYSEIETLPFGHYQDLKQIEVIGNIHDNKEILEVKND